MIKLWDGWVITADSFQYILGQPFARITSGRKKNDMKNATYHKYLNQALKTFWLRVNREYLADNDVTLQEMIKHMQEVEQSIRSLIREEAQSENMADGITPVSIKL